MYKVTKEEISPEITKYKISENKKTISFRKWISLLKDDVDFVDFFTEILISSKHIAFFWEVKSVDKNKLEVDFEFVLVESNSLPKITADEQTFKKYFKEGQKVVSFSNLGGDAQLVVPTPQIDPSNYAHLAIFVRNAPKDQIRKFWQTTGEVYEQKIGAKTVWLSTAGLGVSWLHIRIDSRPKYYRFQEYKVL